METETLGKEIRINNRKIGKNHPVYIIAEISANHNQDLNKALKIIESAHKSGADAVKLQTYTPDTLTINCDNDFFRIKETIWQGKTLYDLYKEAYTPWEWHSELKEQANKLGLDFFSTPFDSTAVDFLEELDVPAYKVASFELLDLSLLKKIASTGKPIIMSTGMATLAEIDEAVQTLKESGCDKFALLKCTSSYPAAPEEMNLRTIPHLADAFNVPTGLSDHSLGSCVSVAAVSLGACIIEKHITLGRSDKGPDSSFSMEPQEFKILVDDIRNIEKALGNVQYMMTDKERNSRIFRRSLFIVEDVRKGENFTSKNVRVIRPGHGLHPRYYDKILHLKASKNLTKGSPVTWNCVQDY